MSNKAEFERQLLALDHTKLRDFLSDTIKMHYEWVEVHGYVPELAISLAIDEMINGSYAKVELDDAGEL